MGFYLYLRNSVLPSRSKSKTFVENMDRVLAVTCALICFYVHVHRLHTCGCVGLSSTAILYTGVFKKKLVLCTREC